MKTVAILLSADSFEKFFGGFFGLTAERYVADYRNDFAWYYALNLEKLGHRVFIYVLSRSLDEARRAPDGVVVRFLRLPRWWLLLDPILYRLGRRKLLVRVRSRLEAAAFGPALTRALDTDAIDVLYVQEIWPDRIDFLLPFVRCELIGADHGAPVTGFGPAKQRTLRDLPKITVQDEAQKAWIDRAGGNAVVIANGIDVEFFAPGTPPASRPRTVLAVGRLADDQKRISDLIRAMAALPDFHLDIVGSGPDQAALTALASELGVGDRVTFHGFVSDRALLRDHYRACGVFCCPSAWEATLLVLLEAMGCGAACVASDIPTLRDALGEGSGLTVPVGDVAALAAAIRAAYDDRETLGARAAANASARFDQRKLMRRLSDFIES